MRWPFPDRYVTADPPRWCWWHTALLLALAVGGVLLWACGQ